MQSIHNFEKKRAVWNDLLCIESNESDLARIIQITSSSINTISKRWCSLIESGLIVKAVIRTWRLLLVQLFRGDIKTSQNMPTMTTESFIFWISLYGPRSRWSEIIHETLYSVNIKSRGSWPFEFGGSSMPAWYPFRSNQSFCILYLQMAIRYCAPSNSISAVEPGPPTSSTCRAWALTMLFRGFESCLWNTVFWYLPYRSLVSLSSLQRSGVHAHNSGHTSLLIV